MKSTISTRFRELPWRVTAGFTRRSRQRRFEMFMELMRPDREESVLDVGVIDTNWRSSNPLESRYPWPAQITAVALDDVPVFRETYPEVTVVVADGRALPFPDDAFDIGFSNAVIEHVGSREQQRRFVGEMVRTCKRAWIATPNAAFPVDPHTLLPFVHWLPRPTRERVLRWLGSAGWASEEMLNPLTAGQLAALFPPGADVRIVRQRTLGLATVLIAVVDRRP